MPSVIRVGQKILYVRYADDWVIGIAGTHKFATEIRDKAKEYLKKELKLELSLEKTKITHLA
jgi:hypothetical protein